MANTNWKCWVCSNETEVEVATNRRRLACRRCRSSYSITGTHVDGRPMIVGLRKAEATVAEAKKAGKAGSSSL